MGVFFLCFACYHKRLVAVVLIKMAKTSDFYVFAAVCTLFFRIPLSHIGKLHAIVAHEISLYSMAFYSWAFPACLMMP